MKFLASSENFIFVIFLDIIVFLLILASAIFLHAIIGVLLLIWIFVAIRIAKISYVQYIITDKKFIVKYMGKTQEISFAEISQITESVYPNMFGRKEYKIKLLGTLTVNNRILEIQSRIFERWLNEHRDLFNIKTQIVL